MLLANNQKNPRKMWNALNPISSRTRQSMRTVAPLMDFFIGKVEQIRSDTASVPSPIFTGIDVVWLNNFNSVAVEEVHQLIRRLSSHLLIRFLLGF